MKIKADLHNHLGTGGIFPSFNYVINVAEKSLGKGGIFVIANTLQNDFRYEKFAHTQEGYERENLGNVVYIPEKDILVIKAHEVIKKEGHLLVLGLREGKNITSKTYSDIFKQGKEEHNAIFIADHPFYVEGIGHYIIRGPKEREETLSQLDGWEGYNATAELWFPKILPRGANNKAQQFYNEEIKDKYDIGIIATTDGHSVEVIGRSHTILPEIDKTNSVTLNDSLRRSIGKNKSMENLVMRPNKMDAFMHSVNMAKFSLSGGRKKQLQETSSG